MGSLVRMRVELDDSPGRLAEIAAVISQYGGNIAGVDVQKGGDEVAVDELTVEFSDNVDILEVRCQIANLGGARVISHQKASRVDPMVKLMRDLTVALGDLPEDRAQRLRRGVADLCGTPAAWLLTSERASSFGVGHLAIAAPGTAFLGRGREPLPTLGETISGESSLLAVAIEPSSDPRVVLVARSAMQSFTTTEADRVEALVEFHLRLHERLSSAERCPAP